MSAQGHGGMEEGHERGGHRAAPRLCLAANQILLTPDLIKKLRFHLSSYFPSLAFAFDL